MQVCGMDKTERLQTATAPFLSLALLINSLLVLKHCYILSFSGDFWVFEGKNLNRHLCVTWKGAYN
jgi:hypothetical protein